MSKRNTLRSALLLAVITLVSMPLFAQPGGPGRRQMTEQDVKDRVARTADSLNLSEKQEKQVLEFELELNKAMQEARQNFDPQTGDREAMRAKMMEIREKRDAKYKEVLTAEQYKKYTKMTERQRSEMRRRRPGGQEDEGERSRGRGRGGN